MTKYRFQRRVAQCRECNRVVDWVTEGNVVGNPELTSQEWDALSDTELKSHGWTKPDDAWVCERHK